LLAGAGVVNFLEAHGLRVAAFGGDHGERLLAAGEGAGFEDGIVFHATSDSDGKSSKFC
jgi:hypothetical protein